MKRSPLGALRARTLAFLALALVAVAVLAGCSQNAEPAQKTDAPEASKPEPTLVRVASMKGPTSIGLADLMAKEEAGTAEGDYEFNVLGTADEVVQKVLSGDVDVALVPANVASMLYAKTDGKVLAIDVNTLSVLDIVQRGDAVKTFDDLAGKTVYLTGKGTTPQYVMEYLLDRAGIAGDVKLEYKSEAPEVVGVLSKDENAVALLPQPYATVASNKVEGASIALNLGDVWTELAPKGSQLVTGVTVVRADFLAEHPDAVSTFVKEQGASVKAVNDDPAAAAKTVVQAGIIDNEAVAAKAIPECGLVCLTGGEMKAALEGYYAALFELDPAAVGGGVPESDFYWLG